MVVPVFEERLDIGKRVVETGSGVRVHKVVHEHEEIIDQPLLVHKVDVQRVPIGKVVDGPVAIRHVGDAMIIPVLEERLVIQKQLILKEEIHITKRQVSNRQPQRVTVRNEEVEIERLAGTGHSALQSPELKRSSAPTASPAPRPGPIPGESILERVFHSEEETTQAQKGYDLRKGDRS